MNLDLFDRQVQALFDRVAAFVHEEVDDARDGSRGLSRAVALAGEALLRLAEARAVLRDIPGLLELARLGAETRARRYEDLFDLAPVAYLTTDLSGRVTDCNREASNLLGGDIAAVLGRPIQARLGDDGGRELEGEFDRLCRGQPASEIAIRLRDDAGRLLDVVAKLAARIDRDGEPAELLWLLRAADAARPDLDRREARTPAAPSRRPPLLMTSDEAAAAGGGASLGDARGLAVDDHGRRPTGLRPHGTGRDAPPEGGDRPAGQGRKEEVLE